MIKLSFNTRRVDKIKYFFLICNELEIYSNKDESGNWRNNFINMKFIYFNLVKNSFYWKYLKLEFQVFLKIMACISNGSVICF